MKDLYIEKLKKYGITFEDNENFDYVNNIGHYRYRKLKTKLSPSNSVPFKTIESAYRFDILINRLIYKYIRPIERSIKKILTKHMKSICNVDDTSKIADNIINYSREILKLTNELNISNDNKNKIIRNFSEIIPDIIKYSKNKTIRRYLDELMMGSVMKWLKIYSLIYEKELIETKKVINKTKGEASFQFIVDLRNAVMHYNTGFNNKKLMSKSYSSILENFILLAFAIMKDLNEIETKQNMRENFVRDVKEALNKINDKPSKNFICERMIPKSFNIEI